MSRRILSEDPSRAIFHKVWIIALSTLALPLAAANAREVCATFQIDDGVEICSEIREQAKVRKIIRWTISVRSTEKPMTLQLRNATPTVVKLKRGCADGIVRTSGGARNRVRCKVKIIGLGTASLEAWPYLEDPQQRADLTASMIVGDLARCEREFQTLRESLELSGHLGHAVYLLDDVEALLMRGERCALSALAGLPELVPMADWFDKVFEEARHELEDISTRAYLPPEDSQVSLAVHEPGAFRTTAVLARSGEKYLGATTTNRILSTLLTSLGLARSRASNEDLLIPELCILSDPQGIRIKMHPWSYSRGVIGKTTNGVVQNIYRGIYAYELVDGENPPACTRQSDDYSCAINLMDAHGTTVQCDTTSGCQLSDFTPKYCNDGR